MVDRATIVAACYEALSAARAARSPFDLARPLSVRVGEVIAALDRDHRFHRVAGDRCWWWAVEAKLTKAERDRRERTILAAGRVQSESVREDERLASVQRERVRAALRDAPGGATAARLAETSALTTGVVEDVLRALLKRGEVASYEIPAISPRPFWRAA